MTDLREAAKMALEALEYEAKQGNDDAYKAEREALRRALADDAMDRMAENARELGLDKDYARGYVAGMDSKLFNSDTSQESVDKAEEQRHEWVGLTDDEVGYIADEYVTLKAVIRATEAKLKEKNHA